VIEPLRTRDKLVGKLSVTGELLRGSLLERTVRHTQGCLKCARGEGHQVFVLTVTYVAGRTQQFSVGRERVTEVRRWLDNYQNARAGPWRPGFPVEGDHRFRYRAPRYA
jgi:hypothetical protein